MNLFFVLWVFALGVLAGLIVREMIDLYQRRKAQRIEAKALRRMRALLWR
jgi:hypothetical protein